MERLLEELKYCLDGDGCKGCKNFGEKCMITCESLLRLAYDRIKEYEALDEQGKLLMLPCAAGDTVYVLAECESISEQLDGTLWDENRVFTAIIVIQKYFHRQQKLQMM